MAPLDELAARWRDALAAWAIPAEILAAAPASPWIHPPKVFRMEQADHAGPMPRTASFAAAARALTPTGGTVLDVGCGGGRSSLPLGALANHVTGVDESEAMLTQFREAAAERHIPCATVLGRWPDIATDVDPADVVICHHVAYNVGDIVAFVAALTSHARRRVVVELTAAHPQSTLNDLWERFWGLVRPSEPTADLFVDIVRALGTDVSIERDLRPPRRNALDRAELVAFVRQRLCLTPDRDPEVDAALGDQPTMVVQEFVTVTWPA